MRGRDAHSLFLNFDNDEFSCRSESDRRVLIGRRPDATTKFDCSIAAFFEGRF